MGSIGWGEFLEIDEERSAFLFGSSLLNSSSGFLYDFGAVLEVRGVDNGHGGEFWISWFL